MEYIVATSCVIEKNALYLVEFYGQQLTASIFWCIMLSSDKIIMEMKKKRGNDGKQVFFSLNPIS